MKYVARVDVPSRNRTCRVGGSGEGALAYACARARGVKCGEDAVLIPHEAVIHRVCVHGRAHDGPRWVDASGERALAGAFTNNQSGAIVGYYLDANNVFHGFLRFP